jgi:hypothetical protein
MTAIYYLQKGDFVYFKGDIYKIWQVTHDGYQIYNSSICISPIHVKREHVTPVPIDVDTIARLSPEELYDYYPEYTYSYMSTSTSAI